LIDRTLASELGVERQNRRAVRLHAAVAAAFAYLGVDDDASRRLRKFAAFAPAAFLGRAHLVVDQHRHAAVIAQLALYLIERAAVVHGGERGKRRTIAIALAV